VTPVLFDSRFFFETLTNTDFTFYIFFRKAFLTMSHTFATFCVFPFIFYLCLFPLGDRPHSTFHVIWIIVCKKSSKESTASIWAKDGTGKPICIAALIQKRFLFLVYCLLFVIHFLYISLSASIYSKYPKTKSCLSVCRYFSTTCVVKYYLEEKKTL
jgi:hypothetical protein